MMGNQRQYFLFDSFQGLPRARAIDGTSALEWQKNTDSPLYFDNCAASSEYAETAMKLSGVQRYKLIEGWFSETMPSFMPPESIAFLHLDADWYDEQWHVLSSCLTTSRLAV